MVKRLKLEMPVPGSTAVYKQYQQLAKIALDMQTDGLRIDRTAVLAHLKSARERLDRFRYIWKNITGVQNLGDDGQTKDVKEWFWNTKHCDPLVSIDKKTRQPKLDTNGALMHYLQEDPREEVNKAAAALIGYRKAAKSLSFLVVYDVDRVHPSWNVAGTKGSRWGCSGPNIQQIPSKTVKYDFGDGPEIVASCMKDIIISEEGMIFVGADYAALELYLQTYIAGASRLLSWIKDGQDLHLGNARIFFGELAVPTTANKKSHAIERTVGKFGYGFSYNVTDHVRTTFKTMKQFAPEITEAWVKTARRRYFNAHPEFPKWQKRTIDSISNEGFISTPLMKRRLYLEASTRGFNQGMNAQCQITGGDMMNYAIIQIAKEYKVSMQVHDSLVLQVPRQKASIKAAGEALIAAMGGPFPIAGLDAMFVVEPDCGPNYKDMEDYKKYL